jgi:hypothetical protein
MMSERSKSVHCQTQKLLFRQLERLEAIARNSNGQMRRQMKATRAIAEIAHAIARLERSADFDGIWTTSVDD